MQLFFSLLILSFQCSTDTSTCPYTFSSHHWMYLFSFHSEFINIFSPFKKTTTNKPKPFSFRVYVTWALWTWSACLKPRSECLWWWRSCTATCWRWSSPVKKADCLKDSLNSSLLRCVHQTKRGFFSLQEFATTSSTTLLYSSMMNYV